MKELRGKVAVVTGAASGLGRGMAERFAEEGMTVVIADNRADVADVAAREIAERGGKAIAMAVDVTQRASVDALAARIEADLGGASVLVNNAGVVSHTPLAREEETGWRWIVDVNLFGVVHGIQAFLPRMVARGDEAHIVNVASLAGIVGGGAAEGNRIVLGDADPGAVGAMHGYGATKHAVVGLSEGLARELSGSRIGVSVVCPSHHENTNIFENSARFRPGEFGGPMSEDEVEATVGGVNRAREAMYKVPRAQRFPDECAGRVVRAILDGHFYVFTHPETRLAIEQRFAQILAGFDDADTYTS